ncbi:hypothetical protein [Lacticaseibacillus manihotivorans]|uniref:hypothetical protein n=1 Tax=Lacticaseibacillus manihotivorans TaxID=88233 RepID=UPI0006D26019|nr:hypothetical protein [Lacticaseibacillus manihotivorans]
MTVFNCSASDINTKKFVNGSGLAERRKTGQLPVAVESRMTPGFGGMRRFYRQILKQSGFLWFKI